MTHFLAFLGVSALIIIVPGPDTALTIRNALVGGRRGGIASAAGVASGQATWAVFTAAGVAALLRASQPAFTAVRMAGAAYLVYLGLTTLAAAARARHNHSQERRSKVFSSSLHSSAAYRQGLLSNLSNPKMIVFFISLLPQFSRHDSFPTLLALGAIFCLMTFLWLSGSAIAIAEARNILHRQRLRQTLDALAGLTLIGLGLRLSLEQQ